MRLNTDLSPPARAPLPGGIAARSMRDLQAAFNCGRLALSAAVPWLPTSLQRALQVVRLGTMLRHCHRRVPYYRRLFQQAGLTPADITGPRDLARLPVSGRAELAACPVEQLTAGPARGRVAALRSSGTSGTPFTTRLDRPDVLRRRLAYLRMQRTMGRRPDDLLVAVVPRRCGVSPRDHVQLLNFRLREEYLPLDADPCAILRRLREARPDLLLGYASVLLDLARRARDRGQGPRPRLVLSTAEHWLPGQRQEVCDAFGAPVLDYYSASECGIVAWQCHQRRGYHLDLDNLVVELLDDHGRPVPPGEPGVVVVTSLLNFFQPFVRYRLGDVAALTPGPCSCGVTLPLLQLHHGRLEDHLRLPGGRRMSPYRVMIAMDRVQGLGRYQVVQEPGGDVRVRVLQRSGNARGVCRAAQRELSRLLGAGIRVSARLEEEPGPPQLKRRVVVSRPLREADDPQYAGNA